jgi:lipid-binding SYLF domain-containing protein
MRRYIRLLPLLLALGATNVLADWQADPGDKVQVNAAAAEQKFRATVPRTEPFFDDAYGYAVYPSVTRFGFGFGGAYGKGVVVEQDRVIGASSFWQFTSGIQAGAKNFSMIVFFRDKAALDYFKKSETQFLGQAGLAVANLGVAGTPAYNDGVAIVTMTRFGLMGEFTISGGKFRYRELAAPAKAP